MRKVKDLYLADANIKLPVYTYDKQIDKDILIYDIKETLLELAKYKKRSPRSLKNLCVFSLVKAGIKVNKGQAPIELLRFIRVFKRKHIHLFPTSMTHTVKTNWKIQVYVLDIPCSYVKYAIVGKDIERNNEMILFYLPRNIDDKMNFYVTTYIPRGSYYNLHLRKNPHIDLPILNHM